MVKRKIAVVTGSRAEYGLLVNLITEISEDSALELQLIVTGSHLSPEFGLTYKLIEQDGFKIDAKVEMLLSSDSAIGIAKSVGVGIISLTDVFSRLNPDVIVILGDRFETLAVAQVALILNIPIAHIHGGEISEGAIDDAIRHAITKMSHLHFVTTENYRQRVMQLGENPEHVFNYGAPGLERIAKLNLLDRESFSKNNNCEFAVKNFLVTYHSVTLFADENEAGINAIFEALNHFPDAKIFFTSANADEGGHIINKIIQEYVANQKHRASFYNSLGDLNYLSLLQHVDLVIGNSSSGIIEVPYFMKPTINIGSRQNKRLRAESVIDCAPTSAEIIAGIKKGLSQDFNANKKIFASPYLQDNTAKKIKDKLREVNLNAILVKQFNDIKV